VTYLTPPRVKGEDNSAVSSDDTLPDPRGSLSAVIPAKSITELISRCRRHLKAWLEVSMVLASTGPLCRLYLASMPVSIVQLQQLGII